MKIDTVINFLFAFSISYYNFNRIVSSGILGIIYNIVIKNHFPFIILINCIFCRRTPPNVSKEFFVQEMRLMNELLIPGIFGYDVQKNLTRLQDIIDDNSMSILDVVRMVCIKNMFIYYNIPRHIFFCFFLLQKQNKRIPFFYDSD